MGKIFACIYTAPDANWLIIGSTKDKNKTKLGAEGVIQQKTKLRRKFGM